MCAAQIRSVPSHLRRCEAETGGVPLIQNLAGKHETRWYEAGARENENDCKYDHKVFEVAERDLGNLQVQSKA